jgi:hypothetical protein
MLNAIRKFLIKRDPFLKAPAISENLLQPLEKPSVSENLHQPLEGKASDEGGL